MSVAQINKTVLMSAADYFNDKQAINAYMDAKISIDTAQAAQEHHNIQTALESAGVKVIKVKPPKDCQDGIYTANWALVRGNKAVLANLPNARKDEEAYAEKVLKKLDKKIIHVPDGLRFSGQGDALPCGKYLLTGSGYRTDAEVHQFIANQLGYEVVTLKAVPKRSFFGLGKPIINQYSGWPDSFFYDIDLAIAVLRNDLIAWCPDAFLPESRSKIRALKDVDKIEVSYKEATKGFACNLVSTGETVIMSSNAPKLKAAIEAKGLETITIDATELVKGGGYIRCTTLTLDNE
jgi:N-dimethylarginine dimethylaminohydrolase